MQGANSVFLQNSRKIKPNPLFGPLNAEIRLVFYVIFVDRVVEITRQSERIKNGQDRNA
jgi:hypothetical protein